jgi:hypothetical protein
VNRIHRIFIQAVLIVLGFADVLHAQGDAPRGVEFCPPWEAFLTPTLVDVLFWPGATFR